MTDTHVTGDLGAFALGALDSGDDGRVRAHLAVCSDCGALLDDYRSVARALAAERNRAELPRWEAVRDKIAPRPLDRRWGRQRRILIGGWAATAALLALVSGWTLRDQLSASTNDAAALARSTGSTVVPLAAAGSSPASLSAKLYISQDRRQGSLAVAGLSTTGGPYEVWFVRPDQTRVSGGTFDVNPGGAALVKLELPDSLGQFSGVTVCPAGPDWQWNAELLAGPIY